MKKNKISSNSVWAKKITVTVQTRISSAMAIKKNKITNSVRAFSSVMMFSTNKT